MIEINSDALSLAPKVIQETPRSRPWIWIVLGIIVAVGSLVGGYVWAHALGSFSQTGVISLMASGGGVGILLILYGIYRLYSTSPSQLLSIWDDVGKKNQQHDEVRSQLSTWLNQKVPNPKEYGFMHANVSKMASAQMNHYLSGIVQEMASSHHSNDEKEQTLLALYEASQKCSPTWLEVAKKEYRKLKGGGSPEDVLLGYIQSAKEDLILDYANQHHMEWHAVNYMRSLLGKELGLDLSTVQFDSTSAKEDPNFPKDLCLATFLEGYTPDALIDRVVAKINLANDHPTASGWDQDLAPLLSECAPLHAQKMGVPTGEDFDEATYVLNTFYSPRPNYTGQTPKYVIHQEGVRALLINEGLLTLSD